MVCRLGSLIEGGERRSGHHLFGEFGAPAARQEIGLLHHHLSQLPCASTYHFGVPAEFRLQYLLLPSTLLLLLQWICTIVFDNRMNKKDNQFQLFTTDGTHLRTSNCSFSPMGLESYAHFYFFVFLSTKGLVASFVTPPCPNLDRGSNHWGMCVMLRED